MGESLTSQVDRLGCLGLQGSVEQISASHEDRNGPEDLGVGGEENGNLLLISTIFLAISFLEYPLRGGGIYPG